MSTNLKMHPRKGATKSSMANAQMAREKSDDSIMNTNDSSIVSKRSVSKLYFPNEPDFYQPFVQKYVRRNPLINRGYWLRMHAIEQVVRRFLEEDSGKSKVVVNLGCGYDPLPFQFWHRHASITARCTFVDVDYPQLIRRKRDRMLTDDLLRGALLNTNLRSSKLPVYLRSDRYMALGCDLRDLDVLEHNLRTELDVTSSSILFVAEVSLTYMPLIDSDSLIRWASTLGDARFCLLEQFLPQGSGHPFAQTMLKHFDKLQTPIQAVKGYPSLAQQSSRFTYAGWPTLDISRNLWDLWSDNEFTPQILRRSLDRIEPFDEWEEFALFSGHYFLVVASTVKLKGPVGTVASEEPNAHTRGTNNAPSEGTILTLHSSSTDISLTPRRFGAAFAIGRDAVAFHGGQGPQHRLASIDVLGRRASKPNIQPCSVPQARICHTITNITDTKALLVGGRTSPSQALADCWLIESGGWQQVEELTPARFRHTSTRVVIPFDDSEVEGILVFGGKTGDGMLLHEWTVWIPNKGWQTIPAIGSRPSARFGAAISTMVMAQAWGLLVGGMDSDGTVLDDIWQWSISATPELQLKFTNCTNNIKSQPADVLHARIGAALLPFENSLLLIGGVSRKGILNLSDDILAISGGTSPNISKPYISMPESAYPLLVGFGVVAIAQDEIVIAGGGAVCFSMGSFWNEGLLSITRAQIPGPYPWSISVYQPDKVAQVQMSKQLSTSKGKGRPKTTHAASPKISTVPRIRLQSGEEFTQLISTSKPAILEGLEIGPCTKLWTIEYLKERIGPGREIVVHECDSDRMTFKDKNFQYVKKSVSDFLDGISKGSNTYLRAVSASQPNKLPTKLDDDFPTIAADFQLPDILTSIRENYHSSPLRVSGPVSLWLHYDVLANVLCQVRGTKTLRLYPPADIKYLDFPPGGSSSNVDVLTSQDPRLRHTHPHVASLKPGDVLFIPPMWSHTATPSEGMSVAVNVFFRNLDSGYAAGKDVYGNRDLQAYENGRRDVERIAKAFKNVPDDIAKFYLDRLVDELQGKTDKIGKT